VAIATVKRYLAGPQHRIRLVDLVHAETERVYQEFPSERFSTVGSVSKEEFQQRMREYEVLVERLMAMVAALSYHDTGENAELLTRCVERLARPPRNEGNTGLIKLQYYPALLLSYAGGISALAANRFRALSAILREPECRHPYDRETVIPALEMLNPSSVFEDKLYEWVPRPNAQTESTPVSNHLHDLLRPILKDYLPDDVEYEKTFDVFEYLLGLVYMGLVKQTWAPVGRFAWRWRLEWQGSPMRRFANAGVGQGNEWQLLKAGFFGGSIDQFKALEDLYLAFLKSVMERSW